MNIKHLLLFLSFASAGILGGALIGQYGFGLYPCDLCIWQRWPHVVVMVVGVIGALWVSHPPLQKAALLICCLALLTSSVIAMYHSGVELGWFEGPDACSSKSDGPLTVEQLREQIKNAALVSCSQAMAYLFGLSLATWNALISLALVAFSCSVLGKMNKGKSIA